MRKLRSDSTFSALAESQREQILNWLFHDQLSYAEVAKRAGKELGVKLSETAIGRFYRRSTLERGIGEWATAPGSVKDLRAAARKLLAMAAMQASVRHSEDRNGDSWKAMVALMKLMLRDQEMEMSEQRLALELQRLGNVKTWKCS